MLNHQSLMIMNVSFDFENVSKEDSKIFLIISVFQQDERQSSPPNDHYYDQEWETEIKSSKKSRGKRIPKGGPKEENYTIDETLRQKQQQQIPQEQNNHQEIQERQFFEEESPVVDDIKNIQRFPVIDENKPFVCQQCGLSFAREKALSSHVKVSRRRI